MPCFIGNVAKVDKAAGFPNEIEQIAILSGRGVRPSAGARAEEVYVKRPAFAVGDVANDPVISGPTAGREVVAADRLGIARETVRQLGGG